MSAAFFMQRRQSPHQNSSSPHFRFKDTNLKRIRSTYGYTQAELAKRSGVTLRSIQMYEQRNKDINKASADALYRISRVLGCSMESLLEK